MATPLLLSDANLDLVKSTIATYFTDPRPFTRQVNVTRRVSSAVKAIGGATSVNAPTRYEYINLIADLDELSNGDYGLAQFMADQTTKQTLPEVALNYHLLLGQRFPSLIQVQMSLFDRYPTHVLLSLIKNGKVGESLGAASVQKVVSALETAISRNFRLGRDSMESLIADPAYADSAASSDEVKVFMRKLGRLAVLVRLPQDIEYLWNTKYDSASVIAHTPRTSFVTMIVGKGMSEDSAVAIHDYAGMVELRNEQAWTALLASKSGWSPATMSSSGSSSTPPKASSTTNLADQLINYSNLFGDVYVNPCEDCSSVTGPAAYYVDLLRMLKNCPSDPAQPDSPSLLAKILERRPDLVHMELTCANTNTLIPYVDLANEVMESFISNMSTSGDGAPVPIQAFNMVEGDQNILNASQPQKTQFSVYKDIIDGQVYPLDVFPYNQAIDTMRSFASAFGVSRHELMTTFQTRYALSPDADARGVPTYERARTVILHALAAESLNLQPADYVAITGASIFPKTYYTDSSGNLLDQAAYAAKINLGSSHSYWGYASYDAMVSDDGGLPNVAGEFLARARVSLQDLINLLQSRFLGGRLVLGNTADAPIFNTDITDLVLRHPNLSDPKSKLTVADCFALQAFIRLWRKSGWTMSDLDLGISYFWDQSGADEAIPLISADTILSLSAVKELKGLTNYSIEKLMPLWGLIDTYGSKSLYAKLFLQGDSQKADPVFGKDSKGRFLTNTQLRLSDHRSNVAAALGIPDECYSSVLQGASVPNDALNLANISAMYRVYLFCCILEINPLQYNGFTALLKPGSSPFKTPQDTVKILKEWRACVQEGMNLPQALFITGTDQILHMHNPGYGASDRRMLNTVCSIVTGLLRIEQSVPLGSAIKSSAASAAEVTRIANLVFDPRTAPQVVEFIEGTGTTPRRAASSVYQDVLMPHLKTNQAEAQSVLFEQAQPTGTATEVALALETQAIARRLLFLRAVSPVLKARLVNDLIDSCITSLIPGNDAVLAHALVSDIIRNPSNNRTATQVLAGLLENNKQAPAGIGSAYFQPPSTDTYRFHFAESTTSTAPNVTVDGVPLTWALVDGIWNSNELNMSNGQSYTLRCQTQTFVNATFSTVRSAGLPFSSDVLIYSNTFQDAVGVLQPLLRAAQFIAEFELDKRSIYFMHSQAGNTTLAVDFSQITYEDIRKAQRYNSLRLRTVSTDLHVIEYFRWTTSQDLDTTLAEKLSALTGISSPQILDFLNAKFPKFTPTSLLDIFRNDAEISDLLTAAEFSSKLGIPGIGFKLLFQWATPLEPTAISQSYDHATEMRRIAQSLPVGESGDSPTAKAYDTIRINQRRALATYLLQQNFMKTRGILDFDHLFEYFLVDVQMSPCLQTSRLKQATSAIQLFVQRCILGLEKGRGVSSGTVNLDRWTWMQKYRLWEANRKVFLYPENWLEPSLRDNKSEVFEALEAGILQTDLTEDSVTNLLRSYIYNASEVVDLTIQGYSWDHRGDGDGTLHFFGRTRQTPYNHYYRSAAIKGTPAPGQLLESYTQWTPWKKMDIDITTVETDSDGNRLPISGAYLAPAVRDRRVFLFLPQIMVMTVAPTSGQMSTTSFRSLADSSTSSSMPTQYWQIQMAWTEYRNGTWSPKVLGPMALNVAGARPDDWTSLVLPIPSGEWASCGLAAPNGAWQKAKKMPDVSSFKFTTYTRPVSGSLSIVTIVVDRWVEAFNGKCYRYPCGAFEFRGEQLVVLDRASFEKTPYAKLWLETVPTVFNKVIWPGSSSTSIPSYRLALDDINPPSKLYWGATGVTAENQPQPKSTFTMSFDLSRYSSAAHGLVTEVQWPDSTQTLFSQVRAEGKADNDYEISTSAQMGHALWPALLNATTTNSNINQTYTVLSTNVAQEVGYQLFGAQNVSRNETSMPAAIYTWELGVHSIMLLMERLRDLQQFDFAVRIARYVFDPTIDGTNLNRCWLFVPFREIASAPIQTTEDLLRSLKASSGAESSMSPNILSSREKPFNAHVIARGRTSAYMKRFVMTYIELLIGSGDVYFRQNTLESLPLALQQYVEASHLFGPAPVPLPKMGRRAPRSYAQLEASFDDFSNTVFDLELDFPFWCDPSKRGGTLTDTSTSYGLTGMLRSTYFCVPTNPKLVQLRGLIDDRLFKLRNCQDINGATRSLALYEPPINIGAAIRAMAAGISLDTLINDSVGPMPNVRFPTLLEKAFGMCDELKAMGAAFQAVRETRDAEALTVLQAKQDRVMQEMAMTTKVLAKEQILKSMEELRETRKGHVARLQYWLALTGDQKDIPTETSEWEDVVQQIEPPSTDGLATTSYDRWEISSTEEARRLKITASVIEGMATYLKIFPEIDMEIEPFGVGIEVSSIVEKIIDTMSSVGTILGAIGDIRLIEGSQVAKTADLVGRLQERRMEINAAGRDIKIVDKQMATMNISLSMCDEDIRQQKKMIAHATEIGEFLRNKFTSEQLYIWMDGQLRSLFYQTYLLANDLAKKAQKAYRFERATDTTEYVGQSYWNASRNGLLSGEELYQDLKRLEAAYDAHKGHEFEILKNVSLRSLQPAALIRLQETGMCTFTLPEVLFDYDFPGHYMRRIKTVEVAIPTASEINTDMCATLRLIEHRYRTVPTATNSEDYPIKSADDARFRTDQIPISAIAISKQAEDSGVFPHELEFNDYMRYVPFEGAGLVSKWQLELPTAIKTFDYNLIKDVNLKIKYTAASGGVAFGKLVSDATKAFQSSVASLSATEGLFTVIDVAKTHPSQWTTLSAKSTTARSVTLSNLQDQLPFFAKGRAVKIETITAFVAATDQNVSWASNLTLTGQSSVTWRTGLDVGRFKTVTQTGLAERFTDWTINLTASGGNAGLQSLLFVVRYYLQ